MLFRLAYLAVTNALAQVGLLPMSEHDKDVEILALRHQIGVLQRQLGERRHLFTPTDRAFLAVLRHRLPTSALRQLLVRPDTILRWHSDLLAARHAARCAVPLSGSWTRSSGGRRSCQIARANSVNAAATRS